MATPFLSESLVKLPRFTVPELLALMGQVEAEAGAVLSERQAAGQALPDFVQKAVGRLSQARQSLEEAAKKRDLAQESSAAKRQSDRQMDDAWKAFEAFLKAWSLLDDGRSPGQAEAQRIYDLVIGDGMGFISLPFEMEWQETKRRLEILERQGLSAMVEELGGGRFLAQLRRSFEDYGKALEITAPRSDAMALRNQWEAAYGAVRHYVAKVVALEDPEEAGSGALVRRLMRPVIEWQRRAGRPAAPPPPEEDEPTELAATQRLRVAEEPKADS